MDRDGPAGKHRRHHEQRDQHLLELSLFGALRELLQPQRLFFLDLPAGSPARIVAPVRDEEVDLPESVVALARDLSNPISDMRKPGHDLHAGGIGNHQGCRSAASSWWACRAGTPPVSAC